MSLFERIQNKRYDLQEAPIDDKGNITPEPGEIEKSKKILKKFNRQQKKIENQNIRKNTQQGDQLLKDINKRKSADLTRADAIRRSMNTYDDGDLGNPSQSKSSPKVTTGKGVDQAEVSKQAKDFTKKINKERVVKQKNIFGGEDTVKTKRRVGSNTSRGTRTKTKTPVTPGQKKLNLGDYTKGKVQPTTRLSKSGEIVTDLRTVKKKYPRGERPKMSDAAYKKVVKQASKPEKMVVAPDPIKGGFKKVGATTTTGRRIIKQSVSTDELLKNQSGNKKQNKKQYKKEYKKAFNNKGKTGKNLFQRIKDIGRKSKEYLGKAHQFMIKDAGFRKTSKFAGYGRNITRNTFKNTMRGNTMRAINKVLPGKYKALAAIAAGTYLATRGKKNAGAGSGDGKPKVYDAYQKTLGFDTGKKKEP